MICKNCKGKVTVCDFCTYEFKEGDRFLCKECKHFCCTNCYLGAERLKKIKEV